jgi:hypothetical protein
MSMTVSSPVQQLLAVCVPLAALGLTLGVVYPSFGRYQSLRRQVQQQSARLKELQNAPLPERGAVVAAADAEEGEPSQFFGAVAALATAHRCELTNLDLLQPAGDTKAAAPARPVRAKLTVQGDYVHVRSLLAGINRAPRLYAVTDLSLKSVGDKQESGTGRLTATLTLERYVMPPAVSAADASAL